MGTDLGSDWTEVVGDSYISLGVLYLPEPGLVVTTKQADRGAMQVGVVMKDLQPGNIYRIVVSYDTDGSYDYVEYECTNITQGTDKLSYIRVGGDNITGEDEIAETYTVGSDKNLAACGTPGGLYGTADNSEIVAWKCRSEPSGTRAGLENDSTHGGDIGFDDFYFSRYEGLNSPLFPGDPTVVHRCYTCPCECDGECLSDELTLTITATGQSVCLDGESVTLTYVPGNDPMYWEGSASLQDPLCGGSASTVYFYITCESDSNFVLYTSFPHVSCSGMSTASFQSATNEVVVYSVDCSPLAIVFGPVECSGSGPSGIMYFTITE